MSDASISPSPSQLRKAWRIPALLVWTAVLLAPSVITHLITGNASRTITSLWYRGCCRVLGIEIETDGKPELTRPVLFVANHVSYLDILIIGGLLKAHFIAKAEVRTWPAIGFLADLAGTIFVERRAHKIRQQRDVISASLAAGKSVILFPEGTSSDGKSVLPFKSSLFSVFEMKNPNTEIAIQPITIDYTTFPDGQLIEGRQRALYAWYGDMTLAPHLSQVIGLPGARVNVVWHEVLSPQQPVDRKVLAHRTEKVVREGMAFLRDQQQTQDGGLVTASTDAA